MHTVLINHTHIYRTICRILCGVYIAAAAINDGISHITAGIPFGLYLLYDAYHIRETHKATSFFLVMYPTLLFANAQFDRSNWHWFYPALSTTITLEKNMPFIYNPLFPNTLNFFAPTPDAPPTPHKLPKGTILTISRQYIAGHTQKEPKYLFTITLSPLTLHETLVQEAWQQHARWNALPMQYLDIPRDKLYIDSYTLHTLAPNTIQTITPRFQWLANILSYPSVIAALFILNILRMAAWKDHTPPKLFHQKTMN